MLDKYEKKNEIGTDNFQDKELKCIEENCQLIFIFSVGEQQFYADHGYTNLPKRCPDCRKARKAKLERRN